MGIQRVVCPIPQSMGAIKIFLAEFKIALLFLQM